VSISSFLSPAPAMNCAGFEGAALPPANAAGFPIRPSSSVFIASGSGAIPSTSITLDRLSAISTISGGRSVSVPRTTSDAPSPRRKVSV
jgi:hypothetical protein